MRTPFSRPYLSGRELEYITQALAGPVLAGDGPFTAKCSRWLERTTGARRALLTHSCTAALDMAAILADIGPGDEVIMPSFTFVSTANAFVLRGGVPVFIDVRPDTLNMDERLLEQAITPRTRAVVPVHYAGVGCDMDAIMQVAAARRLVVIEDAAQGLLAAYRGRALGAIGALGALSFHETKNVTSGEGGALLINDPALVERAETIRDKGTNRTQFVRGLVDKYTWVDVGSSYLPGELTSAFLLAQLEQAEAITAARHQVWNAYHTMLERSERAGKIRRPAIPADCAHNAHMYYILLPGPDARTRLIARLRELAIDAHFHYVPLHSAPAGRRYGRACGTMARTDELSARLLRLPLWVGLDSSIVERIVAEIEAI